MDEAFQHPKYKATLSTQASSTGTSARLSMSPCARISGPHPRRSFLPLVSPILQLNVGQALVYKV